MRTKIKELEKQIKKLFPKRCIFDSFLSAIGELPPAPEDEENLKKLLENLGEQ